MSGATVGAREITIRGVVLGALITLGVHRGQRVPGAKGWIDIRHFSYRPR